MQTRTPTGLLYLAVAALIGVSGVASARGRKPEVPLTARGEELRAAYTEMLASLRAEIAAFVPGINERKEAAFLAARAARDSLRAPGEDAAADVRARYKKSKEAVKAQALDAARPVLADLEAFLGSDKLDSKLIRIAVLAHATPRGLAEFAQQGAEEKGLLDKLFADEAPMRQILLAGGANGGEYGEAMQVYAAILEASERARKGGILQRLALGTSIHTPWLPGKEKGGVYGIVYRTENRTDQVERYLHYEKAYLDGELDPAFKDLTTWECRFVTHDLHSNEDLAWLREMVRTYRPDHISNPDYKWRYVRIVKSDLPYTSPRRDPELGTLGQQELALGGICGRRAAFGRLAARAFGIPARASTQTGHGAMCHWTPDGWTVCFGAWWSMAWCGPQGGLDFLLDSQAREHPEDYMQVVRAQWIGDALGEADVSIRHRAYGKGGGLWDALAFYKKRAIVEDAKVEALELTGGMKLGESDELLGDEKGKEVEIPEEDRKIVVGSHGVITIPVAACSKPKNSTDKIAFMKSWGGGTQVHYARLGNRPELLKYTVNLPAAGEYALTARVATVAVNQQSILRLNRRTLVDIPLPYTKGMWRDTEPVTITLKEGRNTLMFTCRAPNRGVSIKHFTLTPVSE